MRVTIQESDERRVTLKIEGNVTGIQVPELTRAWLGLAASLGQRKLEVDIRDLTHIDAAGRNVLADIYSATRAKFLADTPLTKYFAAGAQGRTPHQV
jgi:anti-anti-sigma regulatory factor